MFLEQPVIFRATDHVLWFIGLDSFIKPPTVHHFMATIGCSKVWLLNFGSSDLSCVFAQSTSSGHFRGKTPTCTGRTDQWTHQRFHLSLPIIYPQLFTVDHAHEWTRYVRCHPSSYAEVRDRSGVAVTSFNERKPEKQMGKVNKMADDICTTLPGVRCFTIALKNYNCIHHQKCCEESELIGF